MTWDLKTNHQDGAATYLKRVENFIKDTRMVEIEQDFVDCKQAGLTPEDKDHLQVMTVYTDLWTV